MFRPIYRCIAALSLSTAMAIAVVSTQDAPDSAPVADHHWCC